MPAFDLGTVGSLTLNGIVVVGVTRARVRHVAGRRRLRWFQKRSCDYSRDGELLHRLQVIILEQVTVLEGLLDFSKCRLLHIFAEYAGETFVALPGLGEKDRDVFLENFIEHLADARHLGFGFKGKIDKKYKRKYGND